MSVCLPMSSDGSVSGVWDLSEKAKASKATGGYVPYRFKVTRIDDPKIEFGKGLD